MSYLPSATATFTFSASTATNGTGGGRRTTCDVAARSQRCRGDKQIPFLAKTFTTGLQPLSLAGAVNPGWCHDIKGKTVCVFQKGLLVRNPEGSADNGIFTSVFNAPIKRVNLTRDDSLCTFMTRFCVWDFYTQNCSCEHHSCCLLHARTNVIDIMAETEVEWVNRLLLLPCPPPWPSLLRRRTLRSENISQSPRTSVQIWMGWGWSCVYESAAWKGGTNTQRGALLKEHGLKWILLVFNTLWQIRASEKLSVSEIATGK